MNPESRIGINKNKAVSGGHLSVESRMTDVVLSVSTVCGQVTKCRSQIVSNALISAVHTTADWWRGGVYLGPYLRGEDSRVQELPHKQGLSRHLLKRVARGRRRGGGGLATPLQQRSVAEDPLFKSVQRIGEAFDLSSAA